MMSEHLKQLEAESIYIFREAAAQFERQYCSNPPARILCLAASGTEGIRSGQAAISLAAC